MLIMSDRQIKNVTKGDKTHESITNVGDGSVWTETKAETIRLIEHTDKDKRNTYYTKDGDVRSEVKVVDGKNGKYLRSHKDGTPNDNLLNLPDFPKK